MGFHNNHDTHDTQQQSQLASGVIGLFESKSVRSHNNRFIFDARVLLDIEFTIKLFPYTYQKNMLGIELKIGPKRLLIVQQLRELLERIENREVYVFSKNFSYDPELHSFNERNRAVMNQLIQIYHDEYMYSEVSSAYSVRSQQRRDERMLLIPPSAWEVLLPLLMEAPSVQLEQDNRIYNGIQVIEDTLPIAI